MGTFREGTVLSRPAVVARNASSGAIVLQSVPCAIAGLEPSGEPYLPLAEALAVVEKSATQ